MSDKQIFTALEVADHEVRLVVGEFYNTRFNIIKVERIPCSGLSYAAVEDEEAVIAAIRQAADNARKMLGADIKKVILSIPSYRTKRYSYKTTVKIEGIDQKVTNQDIRNAIKKAESMDIGREYALIQTVCVKYTVNGISSRRIPIGEHCSEMTAEIDLLCADRQLSFDLVNCVEKAGLAIMDIFPDVFAVGKEAALFEQAIDRQVIILKLERTATTLGLLRKGKLMSSVILPSGTASLVENVCSKYNISEDKAVDLLKYSVRLDQQVYSTNPVHLWRENGVTYTINEEEFVNTSRENIENWLSAVVKTCVPILKAGETTVIITGEGGETEGLSDLVQKGLETETRCYIPDTLGGRNAALTACLGLFYSYQDKLPITGYIDDSLDMDAFVKAVSYREKKESGNKEDTLTNKIKTMFLDGKNK